MKKLFVVIVYFLIIDNCAAQENFLGKTREEVFAYILHLHSDYSDTLSLSHPALINEQIQIKKIKKWNTQASENILFDSSNRVVYISYLFFNVTNKEIGMSFENRMKALTYLNKKFGPAELIQEGNSVVYHWEDSSRICEFVGIEKDNPSSYPCVFSCETKKWRDYRITLPLSTFVRLPIPDSILNRMPINPIFDSIRRKIANFPFAK